MLPSVLKKDDFLEDTSKRARKKAPGDLNKDAEPPDATYLLWFHRYPRVERFFFISPRFFCRVFHHRRRNEPGAVGPLSGTTELAPCASVNNNNTVLFPGFPEHQSHQMNADCRLHLWKMKIFTRTCVSAAQDHII